MRPEDTQGRSMRDVESRMRPGFLRDWGAHKGRVAANAGCGRHCAANVELEDDCHTMLLPSELASYRGRYINDHINDHV